MRHALNGATGALMLVLLAAPWASSAAPAVGEAAAEAAAAMAPDKDKALMQDVTQGALRIARPDGQVVECPLKHTDVTADVAGFIARVQVTQTFHNPLREKIEAVYVFPLPHKAAVDRMTMVIGERRIVGLIKRRAEARQIYEEALLRGATAALLEQERPNIFTQSVGNIPPGGEVKIEISYVDVLEYDMGIYEFHFPMVVGPRYIPGSPTSKVPDVPDELKGKVGELDKRKVREGDAEPAGTGWAPDTDRVPDASRITPPVLKPGFRNGHDISLWLNLDAGVPIQDLQVANHKADLKRSGRSTATAALSPADSIPNKDFVLRYKVVGEKPEMAVLSHAPPGDGGYFLLMVQPKEDQRLTQSPPREIVFLIDVSGSMSGAPTAKVIDAMGKFLRLCKKQDTVQVITFAGQARKLFAKPVPVDDNSIGRALRFTEGLRGRGGTEMLKGVKMAINDPLDAKRLRIVIMLTDGYIGNEAEIIKEVGRRCGDQIRFWCIGIGSSPNRFLIDGVARQGGGMAKVLGLNDDPGKMSQEVMARIHRAQLAKIRVDWGALDVYETFPAKIPELWAGRPVILFGRYAGGGSAEIALNGLIEGKPASWKLTVNLSPMEPEHDVLAKVWARNKIEDLMQQTYYAGSPAVEETVTGIALKYALMSQYTSFVAVDESDLDHMAAPARPPRRMLVPVPIPEGTRYEGFFGQAAGEEAGFGAWTFAGDLSWFGLGKAGGGGGSGRGMYRFKDAPSERARVTHRLSSGYGGGALRRDAKRRQSGTMSGLAHSAMPAAAARMSAVVNRSALKVTESLREALVFRGGQAGYAPDAAALLKLAEEAIKAAKDLRSKGALRAAREMLARAYLLADAAWTSPKGGELAGNAMAELEQVNAELAKTWAEALPALDKRLDLVIRDQSLAGALADVGKAAGLKVSLLPGSLEDAAAVAGEDAARVTFLDLRNATAAQALEWVLRPARLTWWVETGAVVAGPTRRGTVPAAWVYDVAAMAIPTEKELEAVKGYDKRVEAVRAAADELLRAVRTHLEADEGAVAWYAPGQLLVFGDAAAHAAVAQLVAALGKADAKLEANLAVLQARASARLEQRRDAMAKAAEARRKFAVLRTLNEHGWRLLAAAAATGELNLEALTELQVAWEAPAMAEALKDPAGRLLALRSAWAIREAARAMPTEKEVADLAALAAKASGEAAKTAIAEFDQAPGDAAAAVRLLYGVLAGCYEGDRLRKATDALAGGDKHAAALAALRPVAKALLTKADDADREALAKLVRQTVRGDDMVALTALACRRAGGGAWEAFRAEARSLLGGQPLSGGVVVLVNSLERSPLKLAIGN